MSQGSYIPVTCVLVLGVRQGFVRPSQQGNKKNRTADGNGHSRDKTRTIKYTRWHPYYDPLHTPTFTTSSCPSTLFRRCTNSGLLQMQRQLTDMLPMRKVVYDLVGIESGGENTTMNQGLPNSTSLVVHLASSLSISGGESDNNIRGSRFHGGICLNYCHYRKRNRGGILLVTVFCHFHMATTLLKSRILAMHFHAIEEQEFHADTPRTVLGALSMAEFFLKDGFVSTCANIETIDLRLRVMDKLAKLSVRQSKNGHSSGWNPHIDAFRKVEWRLL
ncbi:hypothetical protein EDC04DRAFT_2980786 [Pisolithus marmoratus]|nr:hypothetical protein EDC04DRAFT_2980786 [Pisolithus marmoratus]